MKLRISAILLAIAAFFFISFTVFAHECIFEAKDETPPFEYTTMSNCTICTVVIKAGLNRDITFTEDGTDNCYTVTGIGTQTAIATRSGEEKPPCYDISHVDFYTECNPTAVTIIGAEDNNCAEIICIVIVAIVTFIIGLFISMISHERGYIEGWNSAHEAHKPLRLDVHRDASHEEAQ